MNFINSEHTQKIINYHCPRYNELPNIDLYMDQVINIIEKALYPFYKKNDEKIITSSMINNYVKQKVIVSPVNKKYSREQVANLIVVCALKKIMSINDISEIIKNHKNNFAESYDSYCHQLEIALKAVFLSEKYNESDFPDSTHQEKLTKSIIFALANKIYIEKVLEYQKIQ